MDCSPQGSSVLGDSPGKNTGMGCHALLQGIFATQGSNPGLPHCGRILYQLSHRENPTQSSWIPQCLVLKHGHAGGAGPSQSPPHFSSHLHSGPPHQGACSHTCGCASLYRQVLSTPRANSCPSLISGLGVHTSGGTIWLGVQALGVGLGLCGQRILYHLEDHLKEGPWALGLGKHSLGARGWQSWWREHSRSPAPSCLGLPLSSLLCTHCGGGGLVAKSYPTLTTSWTAARQAPLSMGFPRKE